MKFDVEISSATMARGKSRTHWWYYSTASKASRGAAERF
jgi:hypothetical protein